MRKGENKVVECFSGFGNPLLRELLDKEEINQVFVIGLAYDFCVGCTALDSAACGFKTIVISDVTRGISKETNCEMEQKLKQAGVLEITSDQLAQYLN